MKTVSKEGLRATSSPLESGDHLPKERATFTSLASGDYLTEQQENKVTSFVMPQGQNDFNHDKVDQTVQSDKPNTQVLKENKLFKLCRKIISTEITKIFNLVALFSNV